MEALRRFISKLAEKCLPFFDLLKGAKNKKKINWTPECQQVFDFIKAYLAEPHVLSKANSENHCTYTSLSDPLRLG